MSNPFNDLLVFFQKGTLHGKFPLYALLLLLLASVVIALFSFIKNSEQRTVQNIYMWLARFFVGGMWYQQMLWKMPPTFTDNPDGSGGLGYWMGEMVQYAAFKPHGSLVNNVMLPNFGFFAFQVWAAETFIAVSLLLGLFTRLGGFVATLMAINLWLGLYNRPHEWPWAYFFLILLSGFFFIFRAGRALGLDALTAPRTAPAAGLLRRLHWWIS
jgi:uncharacterized membrane protein YphA (DoxX/SURF4 family)